MRTGALFFLSVWLISTESFAQNRRSFPEFDIQGHRGCRGLMPENTIAAMKKAIDIGVTTIELDVVISMDKQVVVSHDSYMSAEISTSPEGNFHNANENRQYNLYKMNYAEIRKWDVGLKPLERFPEQHKMPAFKPLLSDLIDSVEHYAKNTGKSVWYNIETKCSPSTDNRFHPAPGEFVELVMGVINKKNINNKVIIQSFDVRTLQVMHKKFPHIPLSLLISGMDRRTIRSQLTFLGFTPDVYSPEYSLVTYEVVQTCRAEKMKLIPWTVNNRESMKRLIQMGVNGIITDYPDQLVSVMQDVIPREKLFP